MITKSTILTKKNIISIKYNLFNDLYHNFKANNDIKYIDISKCFDSICKNGKFNCTSIDTKLHNNVISFMGGLFSVYRFINKTNIFSAKTILVLISEQDKFRFKGYHLSRIRMFGVYIKFIKNFPKNAIGLIASGSPVQNMVFGKIVTEKESKLLNIIK